MHNKKIQRTRNSRFLILQTVVARAADLGRYVTDVRDENRSPLVARKGL